MRIETEQEAKATIRHKLKDGWLIIVGDLNGIKDIEGRVYTPGTPKNGDLIGIIHPSLPQNGIFLAKKNDELKDILGNPPDWSRTLMINIEERMISLTNEKGKQGELWKARQYFQTEDMPLNRAIDVVFNGLGM